MVRISKHKTQGKKNFYTEDSLGLIFVKLITELDIQLMLYNFYDVLLSWH